MGKVRKAGPAAFTWLLLPLFATPIACGDDDSKSGSPARSGTMLSLEQACAGACNAQVATNCPGVFPPGQCTDYCVDFAGMFPQCAEPWKNLNACMSTAPLMCDRVNGGASVSSKDCGPEIDAFSQCKL